MSQTDRQTDKSTRWSFTAYEGQYDLFAEMPDWIAEWGQQDEICPETGRKHRQGYLRTRTQQRFSKLKQMFPGVHFEIARDWNALLNQCKKTESRDPSGNIVNQVNQRKQLQMHEALMRIANSYVRNKDDLEKRFWDAVKELIREQPADVSLYTNPQVKRAWDNTHDVWIEKAIEIAELEIDDDRVADVNFICE